MRSKIKIYALTLVTLFPLCSYASAAEWTFNAIGPFGGIVTSVVEDADGTIFIGTEGGGVYKSSDSGKTWLSASSG